MMPKNVVAKSGFLLVEICCALFILLIGFSGLWYITAQVARYARPVNDDSDSALPAMTLKECDYNELVSDICLQVLARDKNYE